MTLVEIKMDLILLLEYIDPASLDYLEWLNVGMALQVEGYTASDWNSSDPRHKPGECFRKLTSFEGSIITGAMITQMAMLYDWLEEVYAEGRNSR